MANNLQFVTLHLPFPHLLRAHLIDVYVGKGGFDGCQYLVLGKKGVAMGVSV
jgi:hypothetical protein